MNRGHFYLKVLERQASRLSKFCHPDRIEDKSAKGYWGRGLGSLLCSCSGQSPATLPVLMRGDGERCVTPARAAVKETRGWGIEG